LIVGVRTIDDTAVAPKDYKEINMELQFGKREQEKII
jgi:hypothetical protein